jgi:proline racemase
MGTPETKQGDFGLIFMDARRYPFMCGHGTIGAVTAFVEMGWIPVEARQHISHRDAQFYYPG